jgi:endo-1,4-beta-xylanase
VVLGALPADAEGATLPALTAAQLTAAMAGLPTSGSVRLPGGVHAQAADLRAAAAAFAVGDPDTPDPASNPVAALGVLCALCAWSGHSGTFDLSVALPKAPLRPLRLALPALPGGESTDTLPSAVPPGLVVRPAGSLVLVGTLSGKRLFVALEDPARTVAGHPRLELTVLRATDLAPLLAVRHAKLDATGTVVLLASGSKVPLRPLASSLATRLLHAAGVLFVDQVPLQPVGATSPLLTLDPIVPGPPPAAAPQIHSISQESDGRVLALDSGANPIFRATDWSGTWQWVGPDKAAGLDYFLRELADGLGIRIGVACDGVGLPATDVYFTLIGEYFNHDEIFMGKWGDLNPAPGQFDFGWPDHLVAFAPAHAMSAQGYVIQSGQVASWLESGNYTTAQLVDYAKAYVTTIVSHYKGQMAAWQVINEPVWAATYGTGDAHFWQDQLGSAYKDFVAQALGWARAADPKATLLIPDHVNEGRDQRVTEGFYELMQDLVSAGAPLDAAGIEGHFHWQYDNPAANTHFNSQVFGDWITRYRDLGLQVYITEFDVDMTGFPGTKEEEEAAQGQWYHDYLQVALDAGVTCFTIYGLTDTTSWYNLTNQPWGPALPNADALMLNGDYTPKPAYFAVRDVLKAELRKRGWAG